MSFRVKPSQGLLEPPTLPQEGAQSKGRLGILVNSPHGLDPPQLGTGNGLHNRHSLHRLQ